MQRDKKKPNRKPKSKSQKITNKPHKNPKSIHQEIPLRQSPALKRYSSSRDCGSAQIPQSLKDELQSFATRKGTDSRDGVEKKRKVRVKDDTHAVWLLHPQSVRPQRHGEFVHQGSASCSYFLCVFCCIGEFW